MTSSSVLHFVRLTLLVLVCLSSLPARADDAAAAREHYRLGTKLYDLRRYKEAAKEYEAAFEAKDDPALLFNIAQAYRFAGAYDDAVASYRSYLRRVPHATNRAEVEKRIREMQELSEAQKRQQEAPPEGMLPPKTPVEPRAGFAVLAKQASDQVSHETVFDPSVQARGKTDQGVAIGLFCVGGAAVASGVVLWLWGRHEQRRNSWVLAPSVGPAHAGLTLEGRLP
jgi:tetratricopeptide (TPR) repeat protein